MASGKTVSICFDMHDWPQVACLERLKQCDIYMKRSYLESELSSLPCELSQKVHPYGLYFPFSPSSVSHEIKTYMGAVRSGFMRGINHGRESVMLAARDSLRLLLKSTPPFTPLSHLESISGGNNTVLFQVRLWDPKDHSSAFSKTVDQINQTRIDIVRNLKRHFPGHFVGGITPSTYSQSVCPELHTSSSANPSEYISLVSQSKIVIAEQGLHGTHGAKLGEYFAASRCILSEPSFYSLPHQPKNGEDYIEFKGVDQCMQQLDSLLKNPSVIDDYASNAQKFYKNSLNPIEATMRPFSENLL